MFRSILYFIVKHVCYLFFKVYSKLEVIGLENIPKDRPLIVAANHVSSLDPLIVGITFPVRLRPLAKVELFQGNKIFAWLIKSLGAIPVSKETGNSSGGALKMFLSLLQDGESVMIFPEGGRSPDGKLKPIEGGVTLLATKTGAPIVPMFVYGTYEAMPMGSSKIKRTKITVRIGNPIFTKKTDDKTAKNPKEEREQLRTQIQNELQRMESLQTSQLQ